MAKILVYFSDYCDKEEFEADDFGVMNDCLVIVEHTPDVTGKSEAGVTNKVIAQFKNWDAVMVQ